MIYHAIEAGRICRTEELDAFHLTDFIDDVKDVMLKSRHRNYPILDENDKVVGTISRYHLLKPRRKRVVLVDHNEMSQSVPGLGAGGHSGNHRPPPACRYPDGRPSTSRTSRWAPPQRSLPRCIRSGDCFRLTGWQGLMAAAIVADTVMFKSPTATQRDHRMAERMARIANISLDELGQAIFSASMDSKPTESLLSAISRLPHSRSRLRRQPDHLHRLQAHDGAQGRIPGTDAKDDGRAGGIRS